jgi:Ni/Co efflux regulator RcnB
MREEQNDEEVAKALRRSWPVRKYRLGLEPSDDLSDSTTAEERLEMMWPLTLEAWSLAGKALPAYRRHEAVVRRFRRDSLAKP